MEGGSADSAPSEPTIIHEDEQLLVLNKPAGLVVHTDGRTNESTLMDWLKRKDPSLENVGGVHTLDSGRYVPRFGLLHRIDRETSGILLVAKTADAFAHFQKQFLDRSTEKIYRAFVLGRPPKDEGVIVEPIGRSRSDFRRWTTGEDARGTLRESVTAYRVVSSNSKYSELELTPKTGRTHQLRVHLKSLGFPILADSRYDSPFALGFTRLALHAWKVSVAYPDGKAHTFEAPFPQDFLSARKEIGA